MKAARFGYDPVELDYEPDDNRLRRETADALAGQFSAGWPVPLTRVGEPSGECA